MQKDIKDLTGFESIELKKVLGTSLDRADGIEATYAVAYIFKKREDASVTYNDVLALSIRDIEEFMGMEEDDEVVMPFEADEAPKE